MAKKKVSSQYDDYITNKILGIFTVAFILILGLMVTYRGYVKIDTILITQKVVYWFTAFAAVVAIAGLVWENISAKKGIDTKYKVIRGKNLAVVSAFTALCALIAGRFYVDGIKFLYVIVPAVTVLALIYLIYASEFFFISMMTAVGGMLMWYMSRSYFNAPITQINPAELIRNKGFYASVAVVILLIAAVLVIYSASKHHGEMKLAGRNVKLFQANANYALMYLSAAITALCVAASLFFGAGIAYYLLFVVFGYLFVLAVYYTVKLM